MQSSVEHPDFLRQSINSSTSEHFFPLFGFLDFNDFGFRTKKSIFSSFASITFISFFLALIIFGNEMNLGLFNLNLQLLRKAMLFLIPRLQSQSPFKKTSFSCKLIQKQTSPGNPNIPEHLTGLIQSSSIACLPINIRSGFSDSTMLHSTFAICSGPNSKSVQLGLICPLQKQERI